MAHLLSDIPISATSVNEPPPAADKFRELLALPGDPANPDLRRVIPFILAVTEAAVNEQAQFSEPTVTSPISRRSTAEPAPVKSEDDRSTSVIADVTSSVTTEQS